MNLGSSHLPSYFCSRYFYDGSPSQIWYGPDGLGFWHILMMGWRSVGLEKGFFNFFVVTCNGQVKFVVAKCVRHSKGSAASAAVSLEV